MIDKASGVTASEIVEHGTLCTFHELCVSCNVTPDWVAGLVEEGAIEAVGTTRQEWRFTTFSLLRVAKARRLECDLGLNLPGIALALELLDRLDAMHARLRSLQEAADPTG